MVPSVLPQTIVSFPGQSVLKSSQARAPTQHRAAGTPVLSVCDPSASPTEPARASGAHPVKLNSARVSAYPGRKRPSAPAPSLRRDKSNSSVVADTQAIRNDRLGTLVKGLCSAYAEAPSWEEFVTKLLPGPVLPLPESTGSRPSCHPPATRVARPRGPCPDHILGVDAGAKERVHPSWLPQIRYRAFRLPPRGVLRVHRKQVLDSPALRPGQGRAGPSTLGRCRQRRA